MRSIKPAAVVTGTVVSLALMALAYSVLFDPSEPYIGKGFPWVLASAIFGAHVLGGLVAGGMAGRSPELNGALSALLCPVLCVAGYLALSVFYTLLVQGPAGLIPDHLDSPAEVREFVTDEEFVGAYVVALMMAIYTSVAASVGSVSGSAAGRLVSSASSTDNRGT